MIWVKALKEISRKGLSVQVADTAGIIWNKIETEITIQKTKQQSRNRVIVLKIRKKLQSKTKKH
jgi:hypothetical protein